jgi:uroporphyrinogen-III synthase
MTGLVVVTRPGNEAKALAAEILRRGYEPLIAPMLIIETLDTPLPDLGRYGALAFTSANGVSAFAERSPERGVPAYAVGGATARALSAAGFRDIRMGGGDAESLASLIARSADRRPVLHISGREIARDLSAPVGQHGVELDRVILYGAHAPSALPRGLVAALCARKVAYVLLFSTRTAMIFGTLLNEAGLMGMVRPSTALCLSPQVADGAAALPWATVKIADRPRTSDLLALLPPVAGHDRTETDGQ